LELLLHDVAHRLLGQAVEIALIDGLTPVLADEQVAQHGRTRNAADVRDEDAAIAAVHGLSSRPGPACPALAAWQWRRDRRACRCGDCRRGRSRSRCGDGRTLPRW